MQIRSLQQRLQELNREGVAEDSKTRQPQIECNAAAEKWERTREKWKGQISTAISSMVRLSIHSVVYLSPYSTCLTCSPLRRDGFRSILLPTPVSPWKLPWKALLVVELGPAGERTRAVLCSSAVSSAAPRQFQTLVRTLHGVSCRRG